MKVKFSVIRAITLPIALVCVPLSIQNDQALASSVPIATLPTIPSPTPSTFPQSSDRRAEKPALPERLVIPAISLNDAVVQVGLTPNGEMAVPSGSTHNVGWYNKGTVPGEVGSAVLDAHVFAAFTNLQFLKPGDDIYVQGVDGKSVHFVVSQTRTYALADVPADILFNRADTARLNLITCAGNLTANHQTYDHRLIIYAVRVG
jgi:LPXTG-site transpeptidase (sortase) family protein